MIAISQYDQMHDSIRPDKKQFDALDFDDETTYIKKFNYSIPFNNGVPYIPILEFGDPAEFDKRTVPRCFWLNSVTKTRGIFDLVLRRCLDGISKNSLWNILGFFQILQKH